MKEKRQKQAQKKLLPIEIRHVPRPQFLLLSLTVDVSRYANDNDQEYCYRGTAGDAGCLQHYTLPGGCNKNVTFLVTSHRAQLPASDTRYRLNKGGSLNFTLYQFTLYIGTRAPSTPLLQNGARVHVYFVTRRIPVYNQSVQGQDTYVNRNHLNP